MFLKEGSFVAFADILPNLNQQENLKDIQKQLSSFPEHYYGKKLRKYFIHFIFSNKSLIKEMSNSTFGHPVPSSTIDLINLYFTI